MTKSNENRTTGQDSLGPVHSHSPEEEREVGLRMSETVLRWRRRNRHAYKRTQYPLEEVLLMLDVKKEPSEEFRFKDGMRKLGIAYESGETKDESGE